MAILKALRIRINSVKQTQKITSAMKMVAASKLRRAQENAESARPYAQRMARMLISLRSSLSEREDVPRLLVGTGAEATHLIVVVTSDRGLCGGFNSSIVRAVRSRIRDLQRENKSVKLFCIGRKGRDQLRRQFGSLIVERMQDIGRRGPTIDEAKRIVARIVEMFEAEEFDVCTIVYNRFRTVMTQVVTFQQLVPYSAVEGEPEEEAPDLGGAIYEFEPDEAEILKELLPSNLAVQVFGALLESGASEQGARMTAMENATRNAGEMIEDLNLQYNRSRQAAITKELIEIVSGAEAL